MTQTMSLLGPHQGRELSLMLAGSKPAALISWPQDYSDFLSHVAKGTFVWAMIRNARHEPDLISWSHVFTQIGEEWRITSIANVYDKVRKNRIMIGCDHSMIGILLGYTDEQVYAFLERTA